MLFMGVVVMDQDLVMVMIFIYVQIANINKCSRNTKQSYHIPLGHYLAGTSSYNW
jgi:hypothetical protein